MKNNNDEPTHGDITALAREFWEEEGRPEGKAEEHWARAEAQLRKETPPEMPSSAESKKKITHQ
jgi:hypothetical protein